MTLKKLVIAFMAIMAVLILTECSGGEEKEEGFKDNMGKIKADKIDELVVASGSDHGTGHVTDPDKIKEAAKKAEALRFELDMEAAINMNEMYVISFMDGDETVHSLSLDSSGVYWYDDTPGCYRLTEGEFSYEYAEELFKTNYEPPETNE